MSNFKMIIVVVLSILLTSCAATPPGKLLESDFFSREVIINIPVHKAVAQLREGLRYCGSSSGGVIFVTHHGVLECMPVREDGSVLCDLYGGSGWSHGVRSDYILGRIELRPVSVGTAVVLRIRTYAANKDNILKSWELFLNGRARDVCP